MAEPTAFETQLSSSLAAVDTVAVPAALRERVAAGVAAAAVAGGAAGAAGAAGRSWWFKGGVATSVIAATVLGVGVLATIGDGGDEADAPTVTASAPPSVVDRTVPVADVDDSSGPPRPSSTATTPTEPPTTVATTSVPDTGSTSTTDIATTTSGPPRPLVPPTTARPAPTTSAAPPRGATTTTVTGVEPPPVTTTTVAPAPTTTAPLPTSTTTTAPPPPVTSTTVPPGPEPPAPPVINNVSYRCDPTGAVPTCEGTVNFLRPPGALSFEMVGAGVVDQACSGSSCRFEYAGLLPATLGVVAIGNGGRSEPATFTIS